MTFRYPRHEWSRESIPWMEPDHWYKDFGGGDRDRGGGRRKPPSSNGNTVAPEVRIDNSLVYSFIKQFLFGIIYT